MMLHIQVSLAKIRNLHKGNSTIFEIFLKNLKCNIEEFIDWLINLIYIK